jgi:hypothetical protein
MSMHPILSDNPASMVRIPLQLTLYIAAASAANTAHLADNVHTAQTAIDNLQTMQSITTTSDNTISNAIDAVQGSLWALEDVNDLDVGESLRRLQIQMTVQLLHDVSREQLATELTGILVAALDNISTDKLPPVGEALGLSWISDMNLAASSPRPADDRTDAAGSATPSIHAGSRHNASHDLRVHATAGSGFERQLV